MTKYKFKGYTITNCGYHQPDHCVWWEAVNENGEACFHGNTLREVEFEILDYEWEQKIRRKDEEIERLKTMPVGNAAAMRDALSDACYAMFNFLKTQSGGYEEMAIALDKAKSALSAPPRQCDVGTPEEQSERYNKFCYDHRSYEICCGGCPLNGEPCCELAWAQTPYAAEEGAGE